MEHMYLIYKVGESQRKPHFDIDVSKVNDFIIILLISGHLYIQIHPVLGKYSRCAKYCHIITHVKEHV